MQAARDKDGVFLPKEIYEQQMKTKESSDQEIKEKTLQIKALEEEMEKLNVSYFYYNPYKSTLKTQCLKITINVAFRIFRQNGPFLAFLMNFCPFKM